MKPWFKVAKPHKDIQEGNLDESVFAANLSEVAQGGGRAVYSDPKMFFRKTYITEGLKDIAKRVILCLNGSPEAENRTISLQTGFGGGKTHTLITLYHLAKEGKGLLRNTDLNTLFAFTGNPEFKDAKIAVFTNTTNDPTQGRKIGGTRVSTIWGDIAFQLGGKEAFSKIKENDEAKTAPKGLFREILEMCKPCLILIDELADYCVSASAVKVGDSNLSDQTISFIQELTEAISQTDKCVLIATLPASSQELAGSEQSAKILNALENRIGRIGKDIKPVDDKEIFEIVRRRLFEETGDENEIGEVVEAYIAQYFSLSNELPAYVQKQDFKDKLLKSYPFHPELIDIFRLKWSSHPNFQRTRGVLRLLAGIISDLWKRRQSLTGSNFMIHTSDINLSNVQSIANQITTLHGINYDAVIKADVSGSSSNALKIDNENSVYGDNSIAQGIAVTFLLGSFGSDANNKGTSIEELKLHMLKPDSFNHNDINGALDRFESMAHYLHSTSLPSKRYWFETTPNINILLNSAKSGISKKEVNSEIVKRLRESAQSRGRFNILIDPAFDIPEQKELTMIILKPDNLLSNGELNRTASDTIKKFATKRGANDRIYRNTILFLLPSESGLERLAAVVKDYLANNKVLTDYSSQLNHEQREDIKKKILELSKQSESLLGIAYCVVAKHSSADGIKVHEIKQFKEKFEPQINDSIYSDLKNEEWILESVGQNTLKRNNLFPEPQSPVKCKDILEAFLRFDDKPIISNDDAVQNSLIRYCQNGELAIASGERESYSAVYYRQSVPGFDVSDETFWVVDKSECLSRGDIVGETGSTSPKAGAGEEEPVPEGEAVNGNDSAKLIESIRIHGQVPFENYSQIYTSFIAPLMHNNILIEISIKASSTKEKPITEHSQVYKNVKESAKQLGLGLEEAFD